MERINSFEGKMNCVERYRLPDGRMVCFHSDYVEDVGLAEALRREGIEMPTERVPVYQRGEMIGTVPAIFDPQRIRSTSFLYDARPGDFIRDGDRWVADRMMGPGDFDCVPGFLWGRRSN